jgi:hypothetical protein
MSTNHDVTLQTLDHRVLDSIVGGDANADRDLVAVAGSGTYELCKSEMSGKGILSLQSMADCLRGSVNGSARNFANSLK